MNECTPDPHVVIELPRAHHMGTQSRPSFLMTFFTAITNLISFFSGFIPGHSRGFSLEGTHYQSAARHSAAAPTLRVESAAGRMGEKWSVYVSPITNRFMWAFTFLTWNIWSSVSLQFGFSASPSWPKDPWDGLTFSVSISFGSYFLIEVFTFHFYPMEQRVTFFSAIQISLCYIPINYSFPFIDGLFIGTNLYILYKCCRSIRKHLETYRRLNNMIQTI